MHTETNTDMNKSKRKVGKRLVQYAAMYKKTILLSLLMLAVAISAELTGPFIAKRLIDVNLLGIEKPWYQTDSRGADAVKLRGQWIKRSDHFADNESRGQEVRVLQVDRSFYLIPHKLSFDGTRKVQGTELTVVSGEQSATYEASKLSKAELFSLYKPEIKPMIRLLALYFGLVVISAFFQYGQKYGLQQASNRIIQTMRRQVHAQIHRLPIEYFDNLPAGKVVSRVTNDTEAIRELYVTVLANFFTSSIYIAGIIVALFLLDVQLALITVILIPILVVWIYVYRKFASKYNHIIRARLSDMNGMLNETIQGMPIIRAFRRQKETDREFEELNQEYLHYKNKMLSLNSMTSHNLVGFLRNASFTILIWYFGSTTLNSGFDAITIGVLYAFVDYLNRLFQPVTGMVNQLANLEQALVASDRVFEMLDDEGTDVAKGELPRYKGNVTFDDVSFAYRDDNMVLKNITLEAKQGDTVALVGHTGSGKSSIMNVLFRFYDVRHGDVRIDGIDTRDIPKQLLRQHMGIVLQDPFLFTGTIASNVSLGDPRISRAKVEKALKDVGAWPFISSLSKGLDEPVIEKGSTLSAGQRQLISFARALAFDPAILILDEATANIDTETESIIQAALDVLKKGRTTFIIAHRLSTIRSADQILVLHRGEIAERGDHESLMQLRGRYYQMYELQQGKPQQTAV